MSGFNFNDFGFTTVNEEELEAVQELTATTQSIQGTAEELQARLDKLYNSIVPLLTNLAANPEKEYIYWPNRVSKVEEFSDYILNIYRG
jgi:hypothetical protein